MSLSIQYIFIRPRSPTRFSYSINDNLDTIYSGTSSEVYKFVCQFIKPPLTMEVLTHLDFHRSFIIDVQNNTAHELYIDSEAEIKKLKEEMLTFKIKPNKTKKEKEFYNLASFTKLDNELYNKYKNTDNNKIDNNNKNK
jgi:hypothetical protein